MGKDTNTLNKVSSLYSDVRANPIKVDRKNDENEDVLTNNDSITVCEGDNEYNVEKNRYVAEDDADNKVANTIISGNDYLLGTEI